MALTLRPIGQNDYKVFDSGQQIGRIRYASERIPGIWYWHVQVLIPGPPMGTAQTLDKAKEDFRTAWEAFKEKRGPEALAAAYAEANKRR